jgi:hypothetical protein
MFIQQWINALQLWFGAWVLFNNPLKYDFNDFLISNFALLFSLFGLGAAFQDIADRKETEKSASRIFFLLDRESSIDPLSEEGKVIDTSIERPIIVKKKAANKKKSSKALQSEVAAVEDITDSEDKPLSTKEAVVDDVEDKPKSAKKKKSSKKLNDGSEVHTSHGNQPDKPKSSKKNTSKKKMTAESDDVDHSETSYSA